MEIPSESGTGSLLKTVINPVLISTLDNYISSLRHFNCVETIKIIANLLFHLLTTDSCRKF